MGKTLKWTAWSGAGVIALLSLAGCGGGSPEPTAQENTTREQVKQVYKQQHQKGQGQQSPGAPR